MRGHSRWLVFLLPLTTLAGCTAEDAPVEGALVDHEFRIGPHGTAEINVALNESDEVVASWESSRDLAWNVHSHAGSEVVTHDSGEGDRAEVAFTAPAHGTYSYMWENGAGLAATLDVVVTGKGRLLSTYPEM